MNHLPTSKSFLCGLFAFLLAFVWLGAAFAPPSFHPEQTAQFIHQFSAGGHILGFAQQAVYIANGSHALQVHFLDAELATPLADAPRSADSRGSAIAGLGRVRYAGLWPGITLDFIHSQTAIYETVYTIAAGADPGRIRLRYNAPVTANPNGSLSIHMTGGEFSESAPIAWQEIGAKRTPVEISFDADGKQVGFALGAYDPQQPLFIDPTVTWTWNTFLGSNQRDFGGEGIAVDSQGNTYVVGNSNASWGNPVRSFTSGPRDAFAAKLGPNGDLLWNTFLGGASYDTGYALALDETRNALYVVGQSYVEWGNPVASLGNDSYNTFIAKLNSNTGALVANTFTGDSQATDRGFGIACDPAGNVYVTGETGFSSNASWNYPLPPRRAYTPSVRDAFVVKLTSDLDYVWHTFLGGAGSDRGVDIDVLSSSAIYVTGWSIASWHSPVRPYAGDTDTFVAKLDKNGDLIWNTFLGSAQERDFASGIVVPSASAIYVTGASFAAWGNPIKSFSGVSDAYVAKLNSDGSLAWHTFLGGADEDYGNDIAADDLGNIYVVGTSYANWTPVLPLPMQPYAGAGDAFVAKINSSGARIAHTFVGGISGNEDGNGIALDSERNLRIGGDTDGAWGSPIRAFAGGSDVMVAKIDITIPAVYSISLNSPNPTAAPTVEFRIDFTEPVLDVDVADFGLAKSPSISGASVASVTPLTFSPSASYIVTVNTGTGDGIIRLIVSALAQIYDTANNKISSSAYLDGPAYTIDKSSLTSSLFLPMVVR